MDILLLGGYAFLGRAIIEAAQVRGHTVSAFNRGSKPAMSDVEQLTGDRDALVLPAGRRWDAVIDTSGYIPRHVREAARALRDRIEHYTFISSISVYPMPMAANVDEDAPLAELTPDEDADDARNMETYGARKVACERALDADMPGRVLHVRPGFIVGPHDYSDRFNEWIERAARSQQVIVPGDPRQPMQVIDARDLAAWTLTMIERRATGAYNATGPERPLPSLEVVQTCIGATGGSGTPLIVPSADLKAAGVEPWQHIPFWLEPAEYGIMEANIDRALAAGLRFRPLAETVRDTYAWLQTSDHARRIVFPMPLEEAAIAKIGA